MKKIFYLIIILVVFAACEKQEVATIQKPTSYVVETKVIDVFTFENQFIVEWNFKKYLLQYNATFDLKKEDIIILEFKNDTAFFIKKQNLKD